MKKILTGLLMLATFSSFATDCETNLDTFASMSASNGAARTLLTIQYKTNRIFWKLVGMFATFTQSLFRNCADHFTILNQTSRTIWMVCINPQYCRHSVFSVGGINNIWKLLIYGRSVNRVLKSRF